jgi:hypothetical protein
VRLEYPYVHWIECNPAATVLRFRLGTLSQIITIRLRQDEPGRWQASSSHAIKTPLQRVPYWSFRMPDDKDYALWQVITALTHYYGEAVEAGYVPSEDWLQPFFEVVIPH